MEKIHGKSKNSAVYVHKGYVYNIDKRTETIYRCSIRRMSGCRECVTVGGDGNVIIKTPHEHSPDDLKLQKYMLKQEMLQLARETLQTPKDIFDNVSRRHPLAAAHICFKSVRSQINRERTKIRPPLPDSISALNDQLQHYIPTSTIYKGMITANDEKKVLLFSDDKLLEALRSSTEIYCDGTFSVVARNCSFSQLYTIHIRYMDKMIAVIFALCEARTTSVYEQIWCKVLELNPELRCTAKFIMTDYESAALSALHKYFPKANIHGCWFHFNQAVQRKWNQLGLSYSSNIILSMTMAIPLLPEEYFVEASNILCNTYNKSHSDCEKIQKFLTYIKKT